MAFRKYTSLRDRFEAHVERIPFCECELWVGHNHQGYGRVRMPGGRPTMAAHRLQWEMHNGPIPEGKSVLHTCHNGHLGCVSIDHLYLGTQADNMRDMATAGRRIKGETHPNAKLSSADVRHIRAACTYSAALSSKYR